MAALSAKLRSMGRADSRRYVGYYCPGCKRSHVLAVEPGNGPTWQWDGNVDAPTFSPSILVKIEWSKWMDPSDDPDEWRDEICHSFVRVGVIEFLGDCTHELRGQHVPLPDWPTQKD